MSSEYFPWQLWCGSRIQLFARIQHSFDHLTKTFLLNTCFVRPVDQFEGWRRVQVTGQTVKVQHSPRGETCAVETTDSKAKLHMLCEHLQMVLQFTKQGMQPGVVNSGVRKETGLD